mgnify:FL=1
MQSLAERKPFSSIAKSRHKLSNFVEHYTPCCEGQKAYLTLAVQRNTYLPKHLFTCFEPVL